MKIYQIHEYGGQWEDSFDFIVASYFSDKKAIAEKERLEIEEEQWRELVKKCNRCPLYNYNKYWNEDDVGIYCDKYEPFDKTKHNPDEYDESEKCVNLCWNHEESFYRIEEVEVIE